MAALPWNSPAASISIVSARMLKRARILSRPGLSLTRRKPWISAFGSSFYDRWASNMTVWLRTTTSTMRDAAGLAARGEPHGTVVVAETQTAGIGRHGHAWNSESEGGLYMSIILRMPLPADVLPVLTMALGLAAQRAV